MIYSAKELERFEIFARDGLLGTVHDVWFDERSWLVRYFALSHSTLDRRQRLLPAARLRVSDAAPRQLNIDATQEQVRASPVADIERPLTRADESAMHDHYGWPYYWSLAASGAGIAPLSAGTTNALGPPPLPRDSSLASTAGEASTLRSVREIRGFSIAALDSPLGEVDDVLLDHAHWEIRYIVVDTRKWLPGPKVILSPQSVIGLRLATLELAVDLTRDQAKQGPPFDPTQLRTNDYTDRLYHDYRRHAP